MMILSIFRSCALGALLAALAVPSLAADEVPASAREAQAPGKQRAEAGRSRRVELPFPLDFRAPDREAREPARQQDAGPHPFRELLFKRASLLDERATRGRLSHFPDFS
jgi:hypothetical protein